MAINESIYQRQSITTGDGTLIALNAGQMTRLRNYLIYDALTAPILPRRFYSPCNEDTTLVDLMNLHEGRVQAVADLPKLYTDIGNMAGQVIDGYAAFLTEGIEVENVVISIDGEEDEEMTAEVRELLEGLDEQGFSMLMANLNNCGLVYGDVFGVVTRDANGRIWCYEKEAPSVFPMIKMADVQAYIVNYLQYENEIAYEKYLSAINNSANLIEYVEVYSKGRTMVYRNRELVAEWSQENTGIDEPLMFHVAMPRARASIFGQSRLCNLAETIVDICGTYGSANRAVRFDIAGWKAISGEDSTDAIEKLMGAIPGKTPAGVKGGVINPDNQKIITGKDISIQESNCNVAVNAPTFLDKLDQKFMRKCPLFSLYENTSAATSGYARELMMKQLGVEINLLRKSVDEIVNSLARRAWKLSGTDGVMREWPEDARASINWGPPIPESESELRLRVREDYRAGLIPLAYAMKELGIENETEIVEWLASEPERNAKKNAPVEAANPFLGM